MDNGKRKASEVLTTNDIREGARKWTLADDVGLLAHLEQFSESIFSKTQDTQKQFTDLVDDYEELFTKVGNVTNQFLALQNCQFVENRVYDEETPTEEKAEVKVQNEVEQEKFLLMQYKEAVEVGIKLLDTHFQQVQLPPNSDSDDDDDDDDGDEVSAGSSIIWKPKNPYAGKKFPLVIGSAEWWADDLVGLGPKEDSLDTEKVISESESDMQSLKSIDKGMKSSSSSIDHINSIPTKPTFSDSSSEDLFGLDKNENFNTTAPDDIFQGNSLLGQPDSSLPDFDKEPKTDTSKKRDSSGNVLPVDEAPGTPPTKQPNKVDSAFTRELMAKLSSVTNRKEVGVTEEKKKVEEEQGRADGKGQREDSLFDETDDSSDLFSAKLNRSAEKGVGKKGLFFDGENEDELFKGKSDLFFGHNLLDSNGSKQKKESHPVGGNILEGGREPEKPPGADSLVARRSVVNDLFEDLEEDDILFAAAKPESTKSSLPSEEDGALNKSKPGFAAGSVWDNEDELFNSINAELEDDFFSSSGLFTANVNKATDSKPSEESRTSKHMDLFPGEADKKREGENHFQDLNQKGISAVEVKKSTDNLFGFSPSREPGSKKTTILDSEDDDDDDLFSKAVRSSKPALKPPAFPDDEDTALFAEKPKPADSVSVSSSRSSLFDDTTASKSRLASVFDKDKPTGKPEGDLFSLAEDSLFGGDTNAGKDLFSTKVREKVRSSLFEDCDDGDDLFGAGKGARDDRLLAAGEEGSLRTSAPSSALRETKSEILRQPEREVFAEDLDEAELFSTRAAVPKPKPPDSLSLKVTESGGEVKSVGKLNIPDNLKVRLESAAKHIAGGGPRPSSGEKNEASKIDLLDEAPRSSNLLKCPSKDRVKIPGRRRPQSRRARQEAIRNSGMWDRESSPGTSASTPHPSKDSLSSPVGSNPLSPSTDEEDFFKVPELDTNFEREDQSIFKSDLFESSKSSRPDEGLLFDGAPVLSPLSSRRAEELAEKPATDMSLVGEKAKPKAASIFEDDDDLDGDENSQDDLFGSRKPLGGGFAAARSGGKVRKSLFDEDSDGDEDELFGGRSVAVAPRSGPVGDSKEEGQAKGKGKEEKEKGKEISSFVDPLGLITKD